MTGHRVSAIDGAAGELTDFILDEEFWRISMLVVALDTQGRGREVLVPAEAMSSDSPVEHTMTLKLDRAGLDEAPVYDKMTLGHPGLERHVREFFEHAVTRA